MSTPKQPVQQPRRSGGRLSGGMVAALVIGAILGTVGGASLCAGIVYLLAPRAQSVLEANLPTPNVVSVNDWLMARVFSQVYTAALDAAVSDPAVIDALGQPIETDVETDDLFRRTRSGDLDPNSETIEFDIKGPQGSAVVTVVSKGAGNSMLQIEKITVTLESGEVLDVPPPPPQEFAPR